MREIGKRLYFRNPSTNTVSSASKVGATSSTGSYVRYGIAQADSAEGKVQVKLDNSEDVVTCSCDSPIKQGDRVKVIVTESGALIAMPIGQNIVDYVDMTKTVLAQQIVDKGNEILEEVNGEMDEWKQDHQLTDADIQHQISTSVSGATETWEGQLESFENSVTTNYALKTEVSSGIDGLRSEISETYATSEGVENEINTAISQASGQIQSTVEQNVMNSVGETYATKTELTQTSNDLNIKITGAVNTANDAKDTADEVSTYFTYDATGLKIGQEGSSAAIKLTSGGEVQILTNNVPYSYFYGGGLYADGSMILNNRMGGVNYIGTGQVEGTSFLNNAFSVSAIADMYHDGDYITDYGTSGSVRYWKWANGRREACGSISVSMSAGGSAGGHQISLPFSFTDQYSYRVLVTLNSNSSSPPNGYNNVGCLAYNKKASSFYVTAWNSSNFSMSVDLNWYAIGVGN